MLSQLLPRRTRPSGLPQPSALFVDAVASVKRPPELDRLQAKLEDLRTQREEIRLKAGTLIQSATDGRYDEAAKTVRQLHAKIATLDTEITATRRRRAELLPPYEAELMEALRPVVEQAAQILLDACADTRQALGAIREAASLVSPASIGNRSIGMGLMEVIGIDQRPLDAMEIFAKGILEPEMAIRRTPA